MSDREGPIDPTAQDAAGTRAGAAAADTTESRPDGPSAQASALLRRFMLWLWAAGVLLVAVGAAWRGVDFAEAVALGVGVVLLNFAWTKRTIRSVLFAQRPGAFIILSVLVKLGVTGVVLYMALRVWHLDALGVAMGLSAVLVASTGFVLQAGIPRR